MLAALTFTVHAQGLDTSEEALSEEPVFNAMGADGSFEAEMDRDDFAARWEADARAAGIDPAQASADESEQDER